MSTAAVDVDRVRSQLVDRVLAGDILQPLAGELEMLLDEVCAARKAKVCKPSRADVRAAVCDHLETWANVCATEWGHDDPRVEQIRSTFTMIRKSALLARLIYGGETLRTVKCPKHEGRWVGLETPWNRCEHGCQMTGWLPEAPRGEEPQRG